MPEKSNGYEAIAEDYTRARTPTIGAGVIRKWAEGLPHRAQSSTSDVGMGYQSRRRCCKDGFTVYGVDASAILVSKFRERFPDSPVECNSAEDSLFFSRTFDAIVAWGLMFILSPETQRSLIGKVARALNRHGQFLFTSPKQVCTWMDSMTGLPSISLGHEGYERELSAHGLVLIGNDEDEGENYYYFATKS